MDHLSGRKRHPIAKAIPARTQVQNLDSTMVFAWDAIYQ
jgi:hypothetical protein